ncbi:hypothetical protein ACOSQ4_009885 [Xanthoceras sorbifolium]
MSEPVEKWTRYAFNYRIKSDHPILTLLELLRRKIMVRFSKKWDELEKWNDFITLYAREHLMMNEKEARKLEVIHGRGEWYKTLEPCGKKILVNAGDVHCDCGMWQINGIPCMHAVAEAMKLTYSGSINPIPDESRWPEIEHNDGNANEVVEPPQKRTKVGRPKKARRRQGNAKGKGKGPSLKGKKKVLSVRILLLLQQHSGKVIYFKHNASQQQSQTIHLSSIPIAPPTHVPDVCPQKAFKGKIVILHAVGKTIILRHQTEYRGKTVFYQFC